MPVTLAKLSEGDLYSDGDLRPFAPGLGFLAVRSGAPIIPSAIVGADGIRRGGGLHRPPIRYTIGAPISLDGMRHCDRLTYEHATGLAHATVRRLHGEP